MKTILFPTEFSAHAPIEFRYASELAYFFNARLVCMHVYYHPKVMLLTESMQDKIAGEISQRMLDFVSDHLPKDYKDIEIDYVIKSGISSNEILQTALDENIELIVMGMSSKGKALDSILGSTAMAVVKKADCPVLAIPPKAIFQGIDNLVYTTNFEFRDLGAIQYLKKWSKAFDAPLHCLHIIEENENEWAAKKNMNILKTTFKRHKNIQFDMKRGDFKEEIERFARSKQADIITMISHKKNLVSGLFERSDVHNLAGRIKAPLLVIKDNAYELEGTAAKWVTSAADIDQ